MRNLQGTVKLEIKKQSVDAFTVITPTSVASVKGTSFWLDCSGKSGDKFQSYHLVFFPPKPVFWL